MSIKHISPEGIPIREWKLAAERIIRQWDITFIAVERNFQSQKDKKNKIDFNSSNIFISFFMRLLCVQRVDKGRRRKKKVKQTNSVEFK